MGYCPAAPPQPSEPGNNTFEVPVSEDTFTPDTAPAEAQTQACEPERTDVEPPANENAELASDNKTPETQPTESANNEQPASDNDAPETQTTSANNEQANAQQAESEPQNNTNQSSAADQPGIVQNWLAQFSAMVEQGEEGLARKFNLTKPNLTLAELLAAAKTQNNNGQTQNNSVPAVNQQGESASNGNELNNANAAVATQAEAAQQIEKTVTAKNTPAENNAPIAGQQSSNANQQNQNGLEKPDGLPAEQTDNKPAQPRQAQTPSDTLKSDKPQAEQLTETVISQKANLTASDNLTSQDKNQNNSKTADGSNTAFEQMLSPNNAQASAFESSSVSAQVGNTTQNVSTANAPTDPGQQIQESIQSSLNQGQRQITVQLNPPELGKVSITFQENEGPSGQLTALLEVSRAETRSQIQSALPEMIRNLADSGINIKRFEVVLTDQPEQQALKEQSSLLTQDNWNSRQGSANSGSTENDSSNQWMTETFINSQKEFGEQQMQITDKSINVLA